MAPFGFTLNSDWTAQAISAGGSTVGTVSVTASGTGWYSGLAYFCSDSAGDNNPTFAPTARENTLLQLWYWQILINQEIQGGWPASAPWGCAGSQTVYQPSPAASLPLYGPCAGHSPIVIDTMGQGFHLTDAAHGVMFPEKPGDAPIRLGWTDPAYHNGWLALPKGGKVEALSELFGNFTPQPPSAHPNGYLALAVYDLNHDGVIDEQDPIYSQLRVWIDANQDGVAQPEELHGLAELGIQRLSLAYRESRWTDQYGNQFRYKSSIADAEKDKRTYDVFVVTR